MRTRLEKVIAFLGSPTLTVWLVGIFVVYYLTISVWIGEAFARYVQMVSSSTVFRMFFVLFLLNLVLRVADAVRSRRSGWTALLLRLPLLLGMVLVLASFFLSLNYREMKWSQPLGEGDPIEFPWDQEHYQIVSVEKAINKRAMRTDDSVIFDYEPGITIVGPDGEKRAIGAFPPRKVGKSFLHVLQFGIGPGIELRRGNEVLWKGYVAPRLVPFGSVDTVEIPPYPYQFYLSIIPTGVLQKGKEAARTYDLERPRYLIKIVKGDRTIAEKETEDTVAFDGNMTLTFFTPSDWVLIEAVRDPFLPWFAFSILLLLVGVLLFPFSYLVRRAGQADGPSSSRSVPERNNCRT